jgi:hypothetical protein
MQIIEGNLWKFHTPANWIVITTNGSIRKDGACVMGRGVALQAKKRYPKLPCELGAKIAESGNNVFTFKDYGILTFPVKHKWFEKADLELIEHSAKQLLYVVDRPIYLPMVGCGNGHLNWRDVRPVLEKYFDDSFTVVTLINGITMARRIDNARPQLRAA